MEASALFQLWSSLRLPERRQLRAFLRSGWSRPRREALDLCDILLGASDAALRSMDKSVLFARLFPGETYDNLRLNHAFSYLSGQIEQFLGYREIDQEPLWRELFICRALRRRGLSRAFEYRLAQLEAGCRNHLRRNADWHLLRYQIGQEKMAHHFLNEREAAADLSNVTDALTRFFVLEHIRWSATALSLQSLYGGPAQPLPLSAAVMQEADAMIVEQAPAVEIIRRAYLAQFDIEDEDNFKRLKTLITVHLNQFSPAEGRDLYMAGINFCLRRHNRGERPAYTLEALALYRDALERGLLFENGILPKYTYNNIARLSCLAGERSFAGAFIESYHQFLPLAERENLHRFNLAIFHYLGAAYDRIPALLQTFEFKDTYTNIHARQMLVKSYFELGEWQALTSLLDSTYTYLRRKKEIGYHRETILNFIKFTRKLIKSGSGSERRKHALIARVQAEKYVAEREWLVQKLLKI